MGAIMKKSGFKKPLEAVPNQTQPRLSKLLPFLISPYNFRMNPGVNPSLAEKTCCLGTLSSSTLADVPHGTSRNLEEHTRSSKSFLKVRPHTGHPELLGMGAATT